MNRSIKDDEHPPHSRNPRFTLPPYPPLDVTNLPSKAQHGVLGQLDGTWVNPPGVYGIHTTIMPAPGSTSEQIFGTYHFKTDEYTEKLQFRKNDNPVRNRLGSNEQFNGAINYETSIVDRNNSELHFEMGQYLWLGIWGHQGAFPYSDPPCLFSRAATNEDVKNDSLFPVLAAGDQGPQFVPPYSISRQGSIPHGNSIQLFGSQPVDKITGGPMHNTAGAPDFGELWNSDSLSFDKTMGYDSQKLKAATNDSRSKPDFADFPISHDPEPVGGFPPGFLDPNSGEAYVQRVFNGSQMLNVDGSNDKLKVDLFPYCVQPNLKLSDANADLQKNGFEFVSHDAFTLNTKQESGIQGGSLNNPGVHRYARVADMMVKMWISKVKDPTTGKIFDQLQYEQRIHFEFQFGTNGGVTRWPHIQCNTLRRIEDQTA